MVSSGGYDPPLPSSAVMSPNAAGCRLPNSLNASAGGGGTPLAPSDATSPLMSTFQTGGTLLGQVPPPLHGLAAAVGNSGMSPLQQMDVATPRPFSAVAPPFGLNNPQMHHMFFPAVSTLGGAGGGPFSYLPGFAQMHTGGGSLGLGQPTTMQGGGGQQLQSLPVIDSVYRIGGTGGLVGYDYAATTVGGGPATSTAGGYVGDNDYMDRSELVLSRTAISPFVPSALAHAAATSDAAATARLHRPQQRLLAATAAAAGSAADLRGAFAAAARGGSVSATAVPTAMISPPSTSAGAAGFSYPTMSDIAMLDGHGFAEGTDPHSGTYHTGDVAASQAFYRRSDTGQPPNMRAETDTPGSLLPAASPSMAGLNWPNGGSAELPSRQSPHAQNVTAAAVGRAVGLPAPLTVSATSPSHTPSQPLAASSSTNLSPIASRLRQCAAGDDQWLSIVSSDLLLRLHDKGLLMGGLGAALSSSTHGSTIAAAAAPTCAAAEGCPSAVDGALEAAPLSHCAAPPASAVQSDDASSSSRLFRVLQAMRAGEGPLPPLRHTQGVTPSGGRSGSTSSGQTPAPATRTGGGGNATGESPPAAATWGSLADLRGGAPPSASVDAGEVPSGRQAPAMAAAEPSSYTVDGHQVTSQTSADASGIERIRPLVRRPKPLRGVAPARLPSTSANRRHRHGNNLDGGQPGAVGVEALGNAASMRGGGGVSGGGGRRGDWIPSNLSAFSDSSATSRATSQMTGVGASYPRGQL